MNGDSIYIKALLEIQQDLLLQPQNPIDWTSLLLNSLSIIVAIIAAIATGVTAYIAYIALIYAKKEYELQKKVKESETLAVYNQRYSNDENINVVVKYLIGKKEYPMILHVPGTFEKEMFMRFFEELQYAILQKSLDSELVYDMFAFYALEAYEEKDNFFNQKDEKDWRLFIEFAKSMKKIKEQREKK